MWLSELRKNEKHNALGNDSVERQLQGMTKRQLLWLWELRKNEENKTLGFDMSWKAARRHQTIIMSDNTLGNESVERQLQHMTETTVMTRSWGRMKKTRLWGKTHFESLQYVLHQTNIKSWKWQPCRTGSVQKNSCRTWELFIMTVMSDYHKRDFQG